MVETLDRQQTHPQRPGRPERTDMIYSICMLNGKNMQPRIIYPARLSFRIERETKSFQEKEKLKEFLNTKPALQEILKGIL